MYIYFRRYLKDVIMFIDKNNRWSLIYMKIKGLTEIKIGKRIYELVENCGLLNHKGKAFYVFAENKPQPMKLNYNTSKWLDSESLMSIINNKLVRMIVKPTDSVKDMFMLLGAIGGLVAGVAAVVILLIQLGVITI